MAREEYTPDAETINALYGAPSRLERRKKLMPFLWNVIAEKGQVYGNRSLNNKVNTANLYARSYPGYSEMFTGKTDAFISSNDKINNPHRNVLEHLEDMPDWKGKVVAFTSWDVFPFILNEQRSGMLVNSGYENGEDLHPSSHQVLLNKVQDDIVLNKRATRYDELTFLSAKEYIRANFPKVLFLGLGETDEFAHEERYDLYLAQANKVDAMIAELWHWVQTTPGYKDNTTFIITTDHGRGDRNWSSHGGLIRGSSQAWMAVIGPGIAALGEVKEGEQIYLQQLAPTIAGLAGEEFAVNDIAPALSLK